MTDSELAVSARSLVLVRDSLGLVDSVRAGPRPLAVITFADGNSGPVGATLLAELGRRGYPVTAFRLGAASGPASYDSAAAVARAAPLALFATSVRVAAWKGAIALPDPLARLIEASAAARPTGLISFGTPYLLPQTPSVSAYLLAWTDNPLTEEAVAAALTGAALGGHLPIDLPPGYPIGFGIQKAAR